MKTKKYLSGAFLSTYYLLLTTKAAFAALDETTGIYTDDAGAKIPTFSWILTLIGNVLTTAITLIGLAAFVMLIAGSFSILTSAGNPESMQKGQQTITYAIVGLVLAVLSGFILQIISKTLGIDDLLIISLPELN